MFIINSICASDSEGDTSIEKKYTTSSTNGSSACSYHKKKSKEIVNFWDMQHYVLEHAHALKLQNISKLNVVIVCDDQTSEHNNQYDLLKSPMMIEFAHVLATEYKCLIEIRGKKAEDLVTHWVSNNGELDQILVLGDESNPCTESSMIYVICSGVDSEYNDPCTCGQCLVIVFYNLRLKNVFSLAIEYNKTRSGRSTSSNKAIKPALSSESKTSSFIDEEENDNDVYKPFMPWSKNNRKVTPVQFYRVAKCVENRTPTNCFKNSEKSYECRGDRAGKRLLCPIFKQELPLISATIAGSDRVCKDFESGQHYLILLECDNVTGLCKYVALVPPLYQKILIGHFLRSIEIFYLSSSSHLEINKINCQACVISYNMNHGKYIIPQEKVIKILKLLESNNDQNWLLKGRNLLVQLYEGNNNSDLLGNLELIQQQIRGATIKDSAHLHFFPSLFNMEEKKLTNMGEKNPTCSILCRMYETHMDWSVIDGEYTYYTTNKNPYYVTFLTKKNQRSVRIKIGENEICCKLERTEIYSNSAIKVYEVKELRGEQWIQVAVYVQIIHDKCSDLNTCHCKTSNLFFLPENYALFVRANFILHWFGCAGILFKVGCPNGNKGASIRGSILAGRTEKFVVGNI